MSTLVSEGPTWRVWCFAGATALWVIGLSYVLGRDLNWDFINYHFYGPHLLLEQRLNQDYFAGSLQSYLNPLPYLPQYLMIRAGWNGPLISAALAAFQALNLMFVWLIAKEILPKSLPTRQAENLAMLAVILAMLAPLFISTVGSSFVDATTSVPVLAATWLLLIANARSRENLWLTILMAGILLGVAAGLKLTNIVLAAGIILPNIAFWIWFRATRCSSSVLLLLLACVVGALIAHGYWSWQLWKSFSNPLFPLFNSIFLSPDFPATIYRDTRFLASGWLGLMALPFQIMLPTSWLYAETAPVDIRFAALVVIAGISSIVVLVRHCFGARKVPSTAHSGLWLLTVIFLTSYVAWGMSSRIGRYAIPLWLILGPLLVAWTQVFLRRSDFVLAALLVVVSGQSYGLLLAGNPRWSGTAWEPAWFEASVPRDMERIPMTVLTLDNLSYSAISPFVHRGSRFVNIVGQHVQPAGPRMTQRLRDLLAVPTTDMRVVFKDRTSFQQYQGHLSAITREDVAAILSMYGLTLAADDCEPITIPSRGLTQQPVTDPKAKPELGVERLHACRAGRLDPAEQARVLAARDKVAVAFDAIEKACGLQLNPHGTELLRGRGGWMRNYFNSLHTLNTDGETVFVRPIRSMLDFPLGGLAQWSQTPTPRCPTLPSAINGAD